MSHNKFKVNNISPNNTSNIPINVSDLVNISNIAENDILVYGVSGWNNSQISSFAYPFQVGYSNYLKNTFSNTPSGNYSIGDYMMYRRGSSSSEEYFGTGYTYNTASIENTVKNNSNWIESIDVPSGRFLCISHLALRNDNNVGDIKARWESDNGGFSSYVHIFGDSNKNGAVLLGVLDTNTSNTVRVVIKDFTNAPRLQSSLLPHIGMSFNVFKI